MNHRSTRFGPAAVRAARALTSLALAVACASLAPAPVRAAESGLAVGETLDKSTAAKAEGLLPPEILEAYKRGDFANKIEAWPEGQQTYEAEFAAATKQNAERLALSANGSIVEKASGKLPDHVRGFPFPAIDPKDAGAPIKIYWNHLYGYYNQGNSKNVLDLIWTNRTGVDRTATQEVYFLHYDGQKPKYDIPNPLNLLQQFVATTTAPQDIYGTTALNWRFRDTDKRDQSWAYVPALRRIRPLSPSNRSDGFLGSDLSQDDGPFFDGKPEDFTWTLVGESEAYRLADPGSLKGTTTRAPLPGGGWRGGFVTTPIAGFEDPSWKGVAWAPVGLVLAKRKCWIVEAVPKDKYYLYGKIQLYIDQETFQGAWNRKFSWSGELLNTYMVAGYRNSMAKAPDGSEEWFWGSSVGYQAAINTKLDRATVAGFPTKDRAHAIVDRRIPFEPSFFDYQTLYRFGK